MVKLLLRFFYLFIFFYWVFFHDHSRITKLQGKADGISLTPHYSLFQMKIIASVTKSSHQDRGLCLFFTASVTKSSHQDRYLFFSYTSTLLICRNIKSYCDCYFPQKIRPLITVQLYVAWDYSSMRVGFNMTNKRHTLL